MSIRKWILAAAVAALAAGCGDTGGDAGDPGAGDAAGDAGGTEQAAGGPDGAASEAAPAAAATEIVPGLTMRLLEEGSGASAESGDTAVVHYTGWLHDPSAKNSRGDKFDSSVDRGQPFEFTVGAGQVIRGWDEGVRGMRVGEIRELTIAPHLGYGARGAGPIPPNSTLVFEVELLDVKPGGAP